MADVIQEETSATAAPMVAGAADALVLKAQTEAPLEVAAKPAALESDPLEAAAATAAPEGDPLVQAHDACYVRGSYRSFEFATFEARAGEATVLVASDHATARDMGLAIAGLVTPTSGLLSVAGIELVRPAVAGGASGLHALTRFLSGSSRKLAPGTVGLGYVTSVAEVDDALAVEEAVTREARSKDMLDLLAEVGLATASDRAITLLTPPERARFSAALALATNPQVAAIDLTDAFVAGLSAEAARELVQDLKHYARTHATAILVLTLEPSCAHDVDAAYALNIGASEALANVLKGGK